MQLEKLIIYLCVSFLMVLCSGYASEQESIISKKLLGKWRITEVQNDQKFEGLSDCELGWLDIRASSNNSYSFLSCLGGSGPTALYTFPAPGVIGPGSSSDNEPQFLRRVISGCSMYLECDGVNWQCHQAGYAGDSEECRKLYDECEARTVACEVERESIPGYETLAIPTPLVAYELDDDQLTLIGESGDQVVLRKQRFSAELEAIGEQLTQEWEAAKKAHEANILRYSEVNPLEITYQSKAQLKEIPLNEQHNRRPYDLGAFLEQPNACPPEIDWHPSGAIHGVQYNYSSRWQWHQYHLDSERYCLVMLEPLVGPLDERQVKNFIGDGRVPALEWFNFANKPVYYELNSPSGAIACLVSTDGPWWDRQDSFAQATKWSVMYSAKYDLDYDGEIRFVKRGLHMTIFAQDKEAYIKEHIDGWHATWSSIEAADIRESDKIPGYFEVDDLHNPYLIHLIQSDEIPEKLGRMALDWYLGHILLSTNTHRENEVDGARIRVNLDNWVAEYVLHDIDQEWLNTEFVDYNRIANEYLDMLVGPCES